MPLTPTFQVGPPPPAASLAQINGRDQYVPSQQFYNWMRLFWQWSTTLGNNADGAASFSGSIAIGTSPNWFKADSSGIWLGGATFAASPFRVSMAGALTATSGTFSGFSIGDDYIRDAANSFGLASTVTAGDDVRFWAGATFANRATAPLNVTESGVMTVTALIANSTTGQHAVFATAGNARSGIYAEVPSSQSTSCNAVYGASATAGAYAGRFEGPSLTGTALKVSGTSDFSHDITYKSNVIGTWTSPAFSAGVFTANGSMTWTVAEADVGAYCYMLNGNTMTVSFSVSTTTVGGTPNNELRIAVPASKTVRFNHHNAIAYLSDNGVATRGFVTATHNLTYLRIFREDAGNFTAATDATYVYGQITFEVQ